VGLGALGTLGASTEVVPNTRSEPLFDEHSLCHQGFEVKFQGVSVSPGGFDDIPNNYAYSSNVDGDTVVLNYPVLGNYMTNGTAQGVTDVGGGKVVQVNGVQIVSSANAGGVSVFGYEIASTTISSPIGIVTPKTITVLGDKDVNKAVDGFDTMPVGYTGWTVDKSQFISADDAKITGYAVYDTPMVGIRKVLVGSVAIVGYNAVDYTLNFVIGKGMIVPSQPILEPTAISLAVQPSSVSQVEVAVIKAPSDSSTGIVQAEVPITHAKGFSFKLPENLKDSVSGRGNEVMVKQINDSPLPFWLTYDAKSSSFVAQNVPEGGLPIKVQLISGGQKFVVEIFKAEQVAPANTLSVAGLARPTTLDKTQFALVPAKAMSQLKPAEVSQLNDLQIQKMSPEHVQSLTAAHLGAMSPAKIAVLTQSDANQLRLAQLLVLKPSQIAQVNPAHIAKLNAAEVANLNDEQIKSLTPAQIVAIQPSNLGALQSEQISIMTPAQVQALTPAQFASLTPIQLASLTAAQIKVIGKDHLQSLSEVQRSSLLPEQIQSLTSNQKEAIGVPIDSQPTASGIRPADITRIQSPSNNIGPLNVPSAPAATPLPFQPLSPRPSTSPITSADPAQPAGAPFQPSATRPPNSPITSADPFQTPVTPFQPINDRSSKSPLTSADPAQTPSTPFQPAGTKPSKSPITSVDPINKRELASN
jgi:hypothetical protein